METSSAFRGPRSQLSEESNDQLVNALYGRLKSIARRLMRSERRSHTLQPTALVNEAWLKLATGERQEFADKQHFICVAARAMRQILLDHARSRQSRGRTDISAEPDLQAAVIDDVSTVDLLALDQALSRLENRDPRLVKIVELRCFAELSVEETAQVLQLSPTTVKREWRIARTLLAGDLNRGA